MPDAPENILARCAEALTRTCDELRRAGQAPPIVAAPLYPDEKTIAELVLGRKRAKEWRGLAIVLERQGLPPIDPQFGGRYWPAVVRWFDRRNRLDEGGRLERK